MIKLFWKETFKIISEKGDLGYYKHNGLEVYGYFKDYKELNKMV